MGLQNNQRFSSQQKNNGLLNQFLNNPNPKQFLQNMVMSNPKAQGLIQSLNSSNLTPKQFFYQYAQQQGIDPERFLSSL